MADGQQRSYSNNADKAAASTPNAQAGGCPACVKTGLPVLLVRPGLAEESYAAVRAERCRPLFDSHVAGPTLSFGGYVPRTLRADYVMAFYETPHTAEIRATGGWQAFQVSDGGYLAPYPLAAIEGAGQKAETAFTCQRSAAYATAMLMVIPEAKYAGKVWVGFSDHPWSEPVRKFYAANTEKRDARMTLIDAASVTCARSIPMTETNVSALIADYDFVRQGNNLLDSPYPALATNADMVGMEGIRPETAADVMAQARSMVEACKAGYSADQLKIVSLPDAIGVTAETASARLTQCNSAVKWLSDPAAKSENRAWRLQTALSIEGLLKELDARNDAQKERLAGLRARGIDGKRMTQEEFERMKASGEIPAEAFFLRAGSVGATGEWIPEGVGKDAMGNVALPSDKGLDKSNTKLKDKVLDKLGKNNTYPFREFLERHNARVNADQEKLKRVELDHKAWLLSDARRLVTEHDFSLFIPMDGYHFAHRVVEITHGGAMTEIGLEWYSGFVDEDPKAADAILTRAILGNQDAFFKTFTAKATVKQIKNLIKLFEDASKVEDASRLTLDQRLVKSFPFFDKTVASATSLKRGLDLIANPLATISGAVVLGLAKRQQISQSAVEKFEKLMASILEAYTPDSVFTAQVRFDLALAYWRTADRRIRAPRGESTSAAARPAGNSKVKSLVLAGSLAMALQVPEPLGRQIVTIWRVGGRAGDEVKFWGRATADALRTGAPAFNAAAAVLQAITLSKIPEKLTYGDEQERKVAYAGLFTGGMGLASATLELGEAVLKQAEKARGIPAEMGAARYLKMIAGRISAIALVVDAGLAALKARTHFVADDVDAGAAATLQVFALTASAYALWVGAGGAASASAGFLGLSATGWGLILALIGIAAGFIALWLQDTPVEEWVAKCIWGNADDDVKWGRPEREQEELNKLLLGVRVELAYDTQWIKSLAASAAAAEGWSPFEQSERIIWKSAEIRLWLPTSLRVHLRYSLSLALTGIDGVSTMIYSYINGVGKLEATLEGVDPVILDDVASRDVALISVQIDGAKYRSAQAELVIAELGADGDSGEARNVLVQQLLNE